MRETEPKIDYSHLPSLLHIENDCALSFGEGKVKEDVFIRKLNYLKKRHDHNIISLSNGDPR